MNWTSVNQLVAVGYAIFLMVLLALTCVVFSRWQAARKKSNPLKERVMGILALLMALFFSFELFGRYIPLLMRMYL